MKDLRINNSYSSALERITDRNSSYGVVGDVSNFSGPSGRNVHMPYTNIKIGSLSTGFDGREVFRENYCLGGGINVKRSY